MRKINLPETKGEFKIGGVVTGTKKDNFFLNKKTRTGKDMNIMKFGVETKPDSTVYLNLNEMVRDEVCFYKKPNKDKGETKGTTKKVAWLDRYKFNEEGFRLIGLNIGVTKKLNDKGQEVNDNKTLTEFDACKYIAENLDDGQTIFTRGNIEISSFKNDKGDVKRSLKFKPHQISLAKDIDFNSEDFKENNFFKQRLIFIGITMDDSDPEDKKGILTAKIVTYNSIEDAEFVVRDKKLYSTFKKNLKKYQAITVWGTIYNKVEVEEDTEDCWGEPNQFDKVKKSFIRELVITGADKNSIDTDTYTEETLDEAVRALKEFGEGIPKADETNSGDDWGSSDNLNDTNTEDDSWD